MANIVITPTNMDLKVADVFYMREQGKLKIGYYEASDPIEDITFKYMEEHSGKAGEIADALVDRIITMPYMEDNGEIHFKFFICGRVGYLIHLTEITKEQFRGMNLNIVFK